VNYLINKLAEYLWESEKKNYEENPSEDHIFLTLELVKEWVNERLQGDVIDLSWSIEDVLDQAERRELTISKEEARAVLFKVNQRASCEYGVSWDTIDHWTDEVRK